MKIEIDVDEGGDGVCGTNKERGRFSPKRAPESPAAEEEKSGWWLGSAEGIKGCCHQWAMQMSAHPVSLIWGAASDRQLWSYRITLSFTFHLSNHTLVMEFRVRRLLSWLLSKLGLRIRWASDLSRGLGFLLVLEVFIWCHLEGVQCRVQPQPLNP